MSNNTSSASSQHILISYSEYERLKNIESQFQKLQSGLHKKLELASEYLNREKNYIILFCGKYRFF